jgi:hypothetical protein
MAAGTTAKLAVAATDSAGAKLAYSARNLPRGLSISASGVISGTLPTTGGTSTATVTAADASGAKGSVSFRFVIVPDLAAGYHPVTGPVVASASAPSFCLDDAGNSSASGTKAEFARCSASNAGQHWAFVPDAGPDGLQTLRVHGKCLDLAGTANDDSLQLEACNGSADEAWSLELGFGYLENPASGRCLTDPNAAATLTVRAEIYDCAISVSIPSSLNLAQEFLFPAGPILSAVGKMCAEDPGNSGTSGTAVRLEPCDGSSAQAWDDFSFFGDTQSGVPTTHHGLCLSSLVKVDPSDESPELVEGIGVVVFSCVPEPPAANTAYLSADWVPLANGEIFNTDAGLCVADPGSSTAKGTKLVLQDCDGDAGEIWGVS